MSSTVEAVTESGNRGRTPWTGKQLTMLLIIGVAALMVSLTQSLLVPVLSEIGGDLRASTSGIEWLLTSTLLVGAVAVPVFGRLGDLFGTRRMLLITIIALVAGSLVDALSSNLTVLIIGRAIVGLSVAAVPLSISLVGVTLPHTHARSGIAVISAMLGVGGALGLPLAGLIGEYADYHVLFWICVAGGVLAFPGILLVVPEPRPSARGRLDFTGAVVLAAAVVALLLPLSEGQAWGWGSPATVGLLVAAAVLVVAFVLIERRIASPLVDVRTSARPALLLTNVASLCVGFALFAMLIGTASYVEAPKATGYGFGTSILVGGLCMLPSGIAMLVLSPFSARMPARIALFVGALIIAAGFVTRIIFTGSLWEIIVCTTVSGAGTGIAYAAMPGLIIRAAPRSELAAANGLNTLFRSTGSSLASAVGGSVLAAQTISLAGYAIPSLSAYRILFAICAAAAVGGALLALLVPNAAPSADSEEAEEELAEAVAVAG